MVKLNIIFEGLNVFTQYDDACLVYVSDVRNETRGQDLTKLASHTPVLILARARIEGPEPVDLKIEDHCYRVVQLEGRTTVFKIRPETEDGRLEVPHWLPHLATIDRCVRRSRGPLWGGQWAATFVLEGGRFRPGRSLEVARWAGDHLGVKKPVALRESTIYERDIEVRKVTLVREGPAENWVLSPLEGEDEIVVWVGNIPVGVHHSPNPGEEVKVEHFKWLYQNAPMRARPSDLAHPVVIQPPRPMSQAGMGIRIPLTSTYCPDGQYP